MNDLSEPKCKKIKLSKNLSRPYNVSNITKLLVNNPKYCDCVFLVGQDPPTRIYAHKALLALNSTPFEAMFFGDLKMNSDEPIVIPDQSAVGFLNVIKYICGFKIDEAFNLDEIYETYMIADKYLLTHFVEELFEYIKNNINESNCCSIYDQLVRIRTSTREESSILDQLRRMIQLRSDPVFLSDNFINISQDTLIDLLKIKKLNTDEIQILEACGRWVNARIEDRKLLSNSENKRTIFEPLKGLIRFTDLDANELGEFDQLEEFLSTEEINSLLLHLIKKSRPLLIKYKGTREKKSFLEYCFSEFELSKYGRFEHLISTNLHITQKMIIASIDTFLSNRITFRELIILQDGKKLDIEINNTIVNGKFSFKFKEPLELDPTSVYRFDFFFVIFYFGDADKLSRQFDLEFSNYKTFGIRLSSPYNSYHCIRRINFLQSA